MHFHTGYDYRMCRIYAQTPEISTVYKFEFGWDRDVLRWENNCLGLLNSLGNMFGKQAPCLRGRMTPDRGQTQGKPAYRNPTPLTGTLYRRCMGFYLASHQTLSFFDFAACWRSHHHHDYTRTQNDSQPWLLNLASKYVKQWRNCLSAHKYCTYMHHFAPK